MHNGKRIPGEPGVWALVIGDLFVFTIFFLTFAWYYGQQTAVFQQSRETLAVGFGLVNTLFLLTSSLLVAIGVHRLKTQRPGVPQLLLGAAALGACFVAVKIVEYSAKIRADIGFTTNDFFMLYFAFTGIHLLHVVGGIGVLLVLWALTRGPDASRRVLLVECGATFWHLVDLLWIVLFSLFYLLR